MGQIRLQFTPLCRPTIKKIDGPEHKPDELFLLITVPCKQGRRFINTIRFRVCLVELWIHENLISAVSYEKTVMLRTVKKLKVV
jgi:hypothetical protein